MPRWLIVSSVHHASQGGVGGYVDRTLRAAAELGHEVELLTRPSEHPSPPAQRVHLVETLDAGPAFERRIGPLRRLEMIRPYRYGLWALAVARQLVESRGLGDRYEAIEFVDCRAEGVVSLLSRRVRERWARSPMLIGAHTPMQLEEAMNRADPRRFGRAVYHAWEREAAERADGVFSSSPTLLDQAATPRTARIALPVIMPSPAPSLTRGQRDAPALLVIGSLQPRKGQIEWTESLNIVLKEHTHAHAWLVGPDTPTAPDGASMWRFLESRIAPELRPRVRWFGAAPPEQVAELIRNAALVVVPSRFESFSLAAAEGLGHGRPTLLSDAVGAAALAPSAPTFPACDADALAAAQLAMLADLDHAAAQAAAARAELAAACDPAAVFAQRWAFAASCRTDGSLGPAAKEDNRDAIDAFEWMLHGIEHAERTVAIG